MVTWLETSEPIGAEPGLQLPPRRRVADQAELPTGDPAARVADGGSCGQRGRSATSQPAHARLLFRILPETAISAELSSTVTSLAPGITNGVPEVSLAPVVWLA